MLILFRITLIIILLIVLIKLKLNLALALIINAIVAGILFRLNFLAILKAFPVTLIQINTIEFLVIIYLVLLLGDLLEASGNLVKVIHSLENLFKDYRLGLVMMPALIGLLPMPAGAMLSAPIIKEIGGKTNLSKEKMTHINYWFRHIWEYFWPLYPALLLTAGILNVPIRSIMITQFPLSLFALLAGLIFVTKLPKAKNTTRTKISHFGYLLWQMWPIILIILLVFFANLKMIWALLIGVLGATVFSRKSLKELLLIFKNAFSLSTLGVIYAVFLFKNIMETSGALQAIPEISMGLPALQILIVFGAPFIVGFLTGVNSAFVGITFPVIAPLIANHSANLNYIMLAYMGGFAGVLLSPVHLCLCATIEYYGAELPKVYKYLLPSVLFVLAGALVLFLTRTM